VLKGSPCSSFSVLGCIEAPERITRELCLAKS
jgi:hypothetical protein